MRYLVEFFFYCGDFVMGVVVIFFLLVKKMMKKNEIEER